MSKYVEKHLIWDFDGTLYDTYSQISCAMLTALDDFHCAARPQEVYAHLKISVWHAVCVYAEQFHLERQALLDAFQVYHRQQTDFHPYQGVTPCLRDTKNMGCHHYLFTHRNRQAVNQIFDDDLNFYFSDYITRDDGFADKPAPDALLHLMKKHRFPPEAAFMIGDRAIDMESARNAGMPGILFDPENFFPDLEVAYRVHSMEEITAIVEAC